MAKLGSYYGLCPLIDQKSLLGVCEDATQGCVIVTLGKNMAIKYKLSDQKQIDSWSTKEKLSSPVVYDKKGKRYVAVFNQNFLRIWNEDDKNLDKLKKIKFPIALHTILPSEDEPIIVLKTGYVFTLSHALEMRKDITQNDILDKMYTVEDQTYLKINDTYYVGVLMKNNSMYKYLWLTPNTVDENSIKVIELERNGFKLNGHLLANTDIGPVLYTLWSDGRLFLYPLLTTEESDKPPGNFYSVIETLSRQHSVCMVSLNNNYIALYGADSNQEGASLQIYNTQFRVTQSKHQFKLFAEGSKLWLIDSCLFLTVGQNLAVVPFHLDTEQLAALVGSHKLVATADDEDLAIVTEVATVSWEDNTNSEKTNGFKMSSIVEKQISSFLKEGWSESSICEEIFPKLIDKKDNKTIMSCLDYFIDIPELVLVKIISYTISSNYSALKNIDVTNDGLTESISKLLDKLLSISYSDVLLMPCLRTGLKFDEVLILLQYICYLLSENGHSLPNLSVAQSEGKLIEWGSLLLDAHYQQLLLSRDTNLIDNLKYFKQLVDNYYTCLEDLKKVEPILTRLNRGKCAAKITKGSLIYSIEKIKLY